MTRLAVLLAALALAGCSRAEPRAASTPATAPDGVCVGPDCEIPSAPVWPPPNRPEWRYLEPAFDHPQPPVPGVPPEWIGTNPAARGPRPCGAGVCGGGR